MCKFVLKKKRAKKNVQKKNTKKNYFPRQIGMRTRNIDKNLALEKEKKTMLQLNNFFSFGFFFFTFHTRFKRIK